MHSVAFGRLLSKTVPFFKKNISWIRSWAIHYWKKQLCGLKLCIVVYAVWKLGNNQTQMARYDFAHVSRDQFKQTWYSSRRTVSHTIPLDGRQIYSAGVGQIISLQPNSKLKTMLIVSVLRAFSNSR